MREFLFGAASLYAVLAVCGLASSAQAVDKEYCAEYAQGAVDDYNQAAKYPACQVVIQQNVLRWQPFYQNHYNGCKMFGRTVSDSERAARSAALSQCAHD